MVTYRLTPTASKVVKESDISTHPHRSSTQAPSLKNNVKEKNAEIDYRNKNTKKKISNISTIARCNKWQWYGHITVDCTCPIEIATVNESSIVAPESENVISSKTTPVIKKFSVVSLATATAVPTVPVTTTDHPFSSLPLLSSPPTPQPLAVALSFSPTIVICSNCHPLPPLLSTSFPFFLTLPLHLRTFVGEHDENWDLKLFITKFVYNTSFNRIIDKKPHEIVYGVKPTQTIDHIPIVEHYWAPESKFTSRITRGN